MGLRRIGTETEPVRTPEDKAHDALAGIVDPLLLRRDGLVDHAEAQQRLLSQPITVLEVARAARLDTKTATAVLGQGVELKGEAPDRTRLVVTLGELPTIAEVLPRTRGAVVVGQSVETQRYSRRTVVIKTA